mmetsp:Transcript_50869/g.115865  ORF Transcript_50869/g.115865 Transcript_50869/m.115865 type:complete len:154 (+) Transcript_50869:3-464(+)
MAHLPFSEEPGAMSPEMGMTASSRRPWRQVAAAIAVICVGVGAVALIVGHAQLSASQQVYMLMPKPQLTTELWFGPGISDDLNRMVKIGQGMSPKLTEYLKKGLEQQSKMVHLDEVHSGEADMATAEAEMWRDNLGDNNGGNEPCMKEPGECP